MDIRSLLIVSAVTGVYIVTGIIHALSIKNGEFVLYALVLIPVLGVGYYLLYLLRLPVYLAWLLALLGALHLAGGTILVNGEVLYNYVLISIPNWTGLTIWKFDQLVHPYGAFVVALIAYAALRRWTPLPTLAIVPIAFLIANGAGALNEVVEFVTAITIPDTNVGGYYNTALDLFFNMLGAGVGSVAAFVVNKDIHTS